MTWTIAFTLIFLILLIKAIGNLCLDIDRLKVRIKKLESSTDNLDNFVKDIVSIGVDVHFKEPHMILIYTRLAGGQIRHIEAYFKDVRELNDLVKQLCDRYKTQQVIFDIPAGMRGLFPDEEI